MAWKHVGTIGGVAGLAWLAVIWLWPIAPIAITTDDAFYYFGIARHLSSDHALTFDGVEPTSGFHPLWLFAITPFGRLMGSAPDAAVRLILSLQVLLVGASLRLLGPRRALVFSLCGLVFGFGKIFINGLESALELLLLSWAISLAESPRGSRLGTIAFAGSLLTLSRLSAFAGAAVLLVVAARREEVSLRRFSCLGAILVAPVVAYTAFLWTRFGHPFPISGAIKYGSPFALAAIVGLGLTASVLDRPSWPVWAVPLSSWIGVQLVSDVVLRHRVVPEIWYLVPHAVLFVLVALRALESRPRARAIAGAGVTIAAIASWLLRFRESSYSTYAEAKAVGLWLSQNTPRDGAVAGWDCGIAAYYSGRRFSNLDGLASSWEYKVAYRDRGRVREYLDARNIDYVAQYVPVTSTGRFHGVDLSDWQVVYDRPFEFRGLLDSDTTRYRYVVLERARR